MKTIKKQQHSSSFLYCTVECMVFIILPTWTSSVVGFVVSTRMEKHATVEKCRRD